MYFQGFVEVNTIRLRERPEKPRNHHEPRQFHSSSPFHLLPETQHGLLRLLLMLAERNLIAQMCVPYFVVKD